MRVHPTLGSVVTSGFRTLKRPTHNGTDFRAPTGTPLYAAQSGTVKTGRNHPRAGNWVEIHADGTLAGYSHLSRVDVSPGQYVNAGDVIGLSGATGNVTGPHLHFYVKRNGIYQNPARWLEGASLVPKPPPVYTPKGNATVTAYQTRQNTYGAAGLLPDGVAGKFTQGWEAWVRKAQTDLNRWKSELPKLIVDGDYGPKMHARVKEMQRRNDRPVTGFLSNADIAYMRKHGSKLSDRPATR